MKEYYQRNLYGNNAYKIKLNTHEHDFIYLPLKDLNGNNIFREICPCGFVNFVKK